jgi:hypothetical protein
VQPEMGRKKQSKEVRSPQENEEEEEEEEEE